MCILNTELIVKEFIKVFMYKIRQLLPINGPASRIKISLKAFKVPETVLNNSITN